MKNSSYIALMLLALAAAAWAGAVWFSNTINDDEAVYAASISQMQQSQDTQSSSQRLQALASDTTQDRAALDQAFGTDVVSIAGMLKAAGTEAGVAVTISGALPETSSSDTTDTTTSSATATSVNAIGFVVEGDGSFPALMRTAQLLESLPIPSDVTQLDIEQTPSTPTTPPGSWHMSVYVHVLTTAPISS